MEKLVRDKIIKKILQEWRIPKYRQVSWQERLDFLLSKLIEESLELKEDRNIEEFADVLEVIEALKKEMWFNDDEIKEAKEKKLNKNWGFDEWYILEIN